MPNEVHDQRGVRLAVLCDYPEENWPSMDLAAEMLFHGLQSGHSNRFHVRKVCPEFRHRFTRAPWLGRRKLVRNADRLLNRMWYYPKYLKRLVHEFDFFHLCDHSYSQLIHVLPPERTGVFCHDLDTFRSVLEPEKDKRPRWYRMMTRRVLKGFEKAAIVFHSTNFIREEILKFGLVAPEKLVLAPLGASPEFTPSSEGNDLLPDSKLQDAPYVLHVGSCIPRKRMDVLLEVFATVRKAHPDLLLAKVGGPWTAEQQELLERLDLGNSIVQMGGLTREQIAGLYRQAKIVLMPSEAEGLGLPVIEALACGAVVVASDIPVFREVGEDAVVYCPLADVPVWSATVDKILSGTMSVPTPEQRASRAKLYSWESHCKKILAGYERLMGKVSFAAPSA